MGSSCQRLFYTKSDKVYPPQTPPKDIMLGEPDRSDDDSPEQEEKEDVIYAPPKLRSPTSHNKRLSHIFDIVETPIKGSASHSPRLNPRHQTHG